MWRRVPATSRSWSWIEVDTKGRRSSAATGRSGASVFGPRDEAVGICLRDERQARERLQALWPMLQESDRTLCLGGAELGVAGDYVDIVGYINMNRELRRENSLPRDRSLPAQ